MKNRSWLHWEENLKSNWRYPSKYLHACLLSVFCVFYIILHLCTYLRIYVCVICLVFFTSSAPFYKIMVPTVDTLRYDFLVQSLIAIGRPILLVGPVGTGKTSVAQGVLSKLDDKQYNFLTINLSAQVTLPE